MASLQVPATGRAYDEVVSDLEAMRARDVAWEDGKAFSLAYSAGPEVLALQKDVLARFHSTNSLNPDAFPSLRRLTSEVVGTVGDLFNGGDGGAGVFTSGGTESILTAIKGARSWAHERGIDAPEMVLPTTAHAAFSKGAAYFGVKAVRVPVKADYKADVEAMAAAITPNTALLVGSTPAYPQGVLDPIDAIGALAAERGVLCHVDACMGFTLPWLSRLGLLPPDTRIGFANEGVTSISCDLHKFGYTAKGHRTKALRQHQFFVTSDWLGGLYGSPAILGTRSGGSLAAAWAVMQYLGEDGYLRLTRAAFEARQAIQVGVEAIVGLVVRGAPEATLLAFGAADGGAVDIFGVADRLWAADGWFVDRQSPPDSIHCTVNAVHAGKEDAFIAAIDEAVAFVSHSSAKGDRSRAYASTE